MLVVDDHVDSCQMYEVTLETFGFDVVCAFDGQTGLRLAIGGGIDAIVLDAEMPGFSGWQLLKCLQQAEAWRAVPVLMVTAHAFPETRQRALDAGCDAYFAKPLLPADLANALRDILFKHCAAAPRPEQARD